MGQNVSADATEVVQFRKMVKYTYYNNLDKLDKATFDPAVGFQISRASYLELCSRIEGRIDRIPDSRVKAAKLDKHVNEKMDFFAAVEQGKVVLGDTLLHVAVRLGHVEIIGYWLDKGLKENVPNFRGEFAHQVCTHPSIQLLMDDVVLVHDVLGYDYDDEAKVHRLVRSLRRMWPLWMFDATETALLVKVLGDVRSSHPFLNKYLKIANTLAARYRNRVSHLCLPVAIDLLRENDHKAYDAKGAMLAWPTDEKLQLMWDVLRATFPQWKRQKDVEKDVAYLHFVEDAMAAWIAMADDLRLYHDDAPPITADVLQNFDRQIWKSRLGPDPDDVDNLCAHIDGVQQFVRAKDFHA
ncbi:hypothetical protein H310_08916 [Aphanomyces invadans]|uniref:Uncharacterized protein n=1 Tax=Aphanomyces invadans TaxID=157072 RepID=A0A024TVY3_9STRA|nr:hypothetical protein H310_08916 [Aphanomyces invadans]ETV98188.1 hypothetical protein H310_08916 [Aphanomyces invadans]|eukprot:XP_008873063.1 hypothetical protein H310_08916 [Aphanomyces invadans]